MDLMSGDTWRDDVWEGLWFGLWLGGALLTLALLVSIAWHRGALARVRLTGALVVIATISVVSILWFSPTSASNGESCFVDPVSEALAPGDDDEAASGGSCRITGIWHLAVGGSAVVLVFGGAGWLAGTKRTRLGRSASNA